MFFLSIGNVVGTTPNPRIWGHTLKLQMNIAQNNQQVVLENWKNTGLSDTAKFVVQSQ